MSAHASRARGLFVTGTDTGVGKTVASVAILRTCALVGQRVVGMKPVSSGIDPAGRVNADVLALAGASNVDAPLADRNPYAFEPAIAPHLAAHGAGVEPDLSRIAAAYGRLASIADVVVVEGAGGVLVPIDHCRDMLDIAAALAIPVVLVVGVRLGCLNHALLSALAIRARGLGLAGWIAARVDATMERADENVAWLSQRLRAPLIADLQSPDTPVDPASLAWLLADR